VSALHRTASTQHEHHHCAARLQPQVQVLQLDAYAAIDMTSSSLIGIASMGSSLQRLALIGVEVSNTKLVAALTQLPMLQVRRCASDHLADVSRILHMLYKAWQSLLQRCTRC
jgi:hypothetical protein